MARVPHNPLGWWCVEPNPGHQGLASIVETVVVAKVMAVVKRCRYDWSDYADSVCLMCSADSLSCWRVHSFMESETMTVELLVLPDVFRQSGTLLALC
jgi:hypothetical protein